MSRCAAKYTKLACAPNKDSDQAARPRSLIRFFSGRPTSSHGSYVSSGGKLCGCAD